MLYLPVIFFALAAVGGLTLVTLKLKGKGLPMPLAIGHGLLAATGLLLLIVNILENTGNTLMNVSLALFIAAALGGFTVFSFHLRKKGISNKLIAVHGSVAVTAFIILLIAVFR